MKKNIWALTILLSAAILVLFFQSSLSAKENDTPESTNRLVSNEDSDSSRDKTSDVSSQPATNESTDAPTAPQGSFTSLASSQTSDDQSVRAGSLGLDELVSLDLRNIEVADAIRFIAQKAGMNLAVSKNVSGRVQLLLNNVPVKDILDIILITSQLAYEKRGDIYYIMTEAEFKERFGRKFSDTRKIKLFHLKYAIPDQAFALFEILKSEIGRLLVDPESGTVLVMDAQENIDRMQSALAGLEQKRNVKVYSLKYAKALDVETRLKAQLDSKKVGLVSADERTNQVIVETFSERMEDIDMLIRSLDEKTKEVLIESKIVKVTFTNDYTASIQWEGMFSKLQKYGLQYLGNHPFSPVFRTGTSFVDNFTKIEPTANPTAGAKSELTKNLVIGKFDPNGDSFEALINFLRTLGETKILSNPKLAVVNNQEAKIHVGQKQAYVTTTQTSSGTGSTTTAEAVTFVDVGIQLAVTPTINDDGFVSMKIKPEISSVVDYLVTGTNGNKIPIIDSSLVETSVMVKDGISILIGGLRKDENTSSNKKIPFLGDLPGFMSAPFKNTATTKSHTELLILITPHIIYGDEFQNGERKVMETPYMSYTDYSAGNPVKSRDAAVKTPPTVHT